MSFNLDQLKDNIISPCLQEMGMHSPAAVNLMLGTCAQESAFGTYLYQLGGGPALGIFQMEPFTFKDIWGRYLIPKLNLKGKILDACGLDITPKPEFLIFNLNLATCTARIKYAMVPEPLPDSDDISGLAKYWKQHYNTPNGKGTTAEFIKNYKKYVSRGT